MVALLEALQELELDRVAMSAVIYVDGSLGKVGNLWEKLGAQTIELAQRGLLRFVVVAADQDDVPPEYCHEDAEPLRVLKASTVHEVFRQLNEQDAARVAVRRYERERCQWLELVGGNSVVPLATHYQAPSLLQAVKRERSLRNYITGNTRETLGEQFSEQNRIGSVDLVGWEETLQDEAVTYEPIVLEQFFRDFSLVAPHTNRTTPHGVVLGPPGSGKSTLIQYLVFQASSGALQVAGRSLVPTRVRLRDWERWSTNRSVTDASLPDFLAELYKNLRHAPTERQWQHWLRRGDVLLLLDGLDEVENSPAFRDTLQATLATFQTCPMILTCRTVSFTQYQMLCSGFPVFTLSGLNAEQRAAYISTYPTTSSDRYEPLRLLARLQELPQLQTLISNPLLLSAICHLVDREERATLPTTRTALYKGIVKGLLSSHRQRVEIRYPNEAPDSDVNEKKAILQQAALLLFLHDGHRLTFTSEELQQALASALFMAGYKQEGLALWTNAFKADFLRNSGLLRGNEQAGFFFLHLTVHEFLVAAALARIVNSSGWNAQIHIGRERSISVLNLVDLKAWDPRWQEVLLFLVGQVQEPLPLLSLLSDEKHDDLFRHRLALAATCLAELTPEQSHPLANFVDQITTEVGTYWFRRECHGTSSVLLHLTHSLSVLGHKNGCIEGLSFLDWLCRHLAATEAETRGAAIEALGRLGTVMVKEPRMFALLACAVKDNEAFVRAKGVEALRRIGTVESLRSAALSILTERAEQDSDWFVRYSAECGIHQLQSMSLQKFQDFSLSASQAAPDNTHDKGVEREREALRANVSSLVSLTRSELQALLDDKNDGVRRETLRFLGQQTKMVGNDPALLTSLIESALHDRNGGVRAEAAAALGRIGDQAPHLQNIWLSLARIACKDTDSGVRAEAIEALSYAKKIAVQYPEVTETLVRAFEDPDLDIRVRAADTLWVLTSHGLRIFKKRWRRYTEKLVAELASLRC